MAEPRYREIEDDPAEPTQPGIATPPPHPGPGGHDAPPPVVPGRRRPWLSPLNQRRWRNFKRNRRALLVAVDLRVLFGLSLFAEFIANDKPILVRYQGEFFMPIFQNFYPETPSAATSGPRPSTATSRCSA
jgi:microcin C transport system permease protein